MKIQQKITPNKRKKDGNISKVSTRTGIERMFKILGFLQNGHIYGATINCKTLGEILEVDRATVMRDIAFLRERLGVEFEWDAEEKKYRLYGDIKYLPSMELDEIDRFVLEFMSQAIHSLGDSELAVTMQKSFQRLFSIFTGKYPNNGWGISANFHPKLGASELRIYHLTTRAIHSGKNIKVTLNDGNHGFASQKEMSPLGIEFSDGQWVIVSVDPGSRDSFRLPFSEVVQIDISKEISSSMPKTWSDHQEKKPLDGKLYSDDLGVHFDDPLKAA